MSNELEPGELPVYQSPFLPTSDGEEICAPELCLVFPGVDSAGIFDKKTLPLSKSPVRRTGDFVLLFTKLTGWEGRLG